MKQSRLTTVWVFGFIIAIITGFAIHEDMNAVALIGVGSIALIIERYVNHETKRPSKKKRNLLNSDE